MNRNSNIVIGVVLIALGVLFLMSNLGYLNFSWNYLAVGTAGSGIYMHFAFTGIDKNPGILVPGGILTTYGALFYANVFLDGILWLTCAAVPDRYSSGVFELYLFGNRDKGLLITVVILGGIGLSSILGSYIRFDIKDYLLPIILIIIGIVIITKVGSRKIKAKNQPA